jgi:hypothetical protein
MSTPWIVINFRHPLSPFICNLLGISKRYVLRSSKDKLQNFYLNNKVFLWKTCQQQFIAQQIDAHTLCTNFTNNTFSILETKPSKSTPFRFFLWIFFFFTPIVLACHCLVYGFHWMQWNAFLGVIRQKSFELIVISKLSFMLTQSHDNTKFKAQHGPRPIDH